jgi:hypothetical protein
MSAIVKLSSFHVTECLRSSSEVAVLQDHVMERGLDKSYELATEMGLQLQNRKQRVFILPVGKVYDVNGVEFRILPITSGLWMAENPVTQELYQAVMGKNPSYFKDRPKCPVESVSWYDAKKFCEKISELTGENFDLPTETEWQYAASPDGRTFPWGEAEPTDEFVCWNRSYKLGTENVGAHPTGMSPFGCQDMSGNVWEWTKSAWIADFTAYVDPDWKSKVPSLEEQARPKVCSKCCEGAAGTTPSTTSTRTSGAATAQSTASRASGSGVSGEAADPKARGLNKSQCGIADGVAGTGLRPSGVTHSESVGGEADPKARAAPSAEEAGSMTATCTCEGLIGTPPRLTTVTSTSDSGSEEKDDPKALAVRTASIGAEALATTMPSTCGHRIGASTCPATGATTLDSAASEENDDPKGLPSADLPSSAEHGPATESLSAVVATTAQSGGTLPLDSEYAEMANRPLLTPEIIKGGAYGVEDVGGVRSHARLADLLVYKNRTLGFRIQLVDHA